MVETSSLHSIECRKFENSTIQVRFVRVNRLLKAQGREGANASLKPEASILG